MTNDCIFCNKKYLIDGIHKLPEGGNYFVCNDHTSYLFFNTIMRTDDYNKLIKKDKE